MDFMMELEGVEVEVSINSYQRGTSLPITSASTEPNDPEELEYSVFDAETGNQWADADIDPYRGVIEEQMRRISSVRNEDGD